MNTIWKKLSGEVVSLPITREIEHVIRREKASGHLLRTCIGTDSQVKGKITEFATVIVFYRVGKGGFFYVKKDISRRMMTIKERMLEEVYRSVEVAHELGYLFSRHQLDLEVHADINRTEAFRSHDALSEALGYITGMGFACAAKPDAFASSSCANKAVR